MPTQKPIIPVAMEDEMLKRIDNYRRSAEGNIPSRSEAIRQLINEGLSRQERRSGRQFQNKQQEFLVEAKEGILKKYEEETSQQTTSKKK